MKLEIKNLSKSFGNQLILKNISIKFPEKGFVFIYGDSGCGKTTLLKIISGEDLDYKGAFLINNRDIKTFSSENLLNYRVNNIGFVYQNFNLLNLEDAKTNISLPLLCSSKLTSEIRNRRNKSVIESLRLENIENSTVNICSGGEKQRIAIGRAIINSPSVLLCDEPTGSLDENNSKEIFSILKTLSKDMLVIVVSHDLSVSEYADKIINVRNKAVTIKNNKKYVFKDKSFKLIGGHIKKKTPSLPLSFMIKHSIKKIKEKKYRSLFTNSILSFALTGIGISLILSLSFKEKINDAFSSLIERNQIVVRNKGSDETSISNIYSVPKKKIEEVYNNYFDYLEYVGVSYQVNFENYFKDRNEFYLDSNSKTYVLHKLSIRSVNEYKVLNNNDDEILAYPYMPKNLKNDEIILSLNYVDMVNICFFLQIQRSYSSLGNYLQNNNLNVIASVANFSWQYEDEQIYKIKAVIEDNETMICHFNSVWNEYVFENEMRFPSDDDHEQFFPWEMYKIYYLKTKDDPKKFLDIAFLDNSLSDIVFERANKDNTPLFCKISGYCKEKRVYCYYADKKSLSFEGVDALFDSYKELKNYYFGSSFTYNVFGETFLSGFLNNFYISPSKESLDEVTDLSENISNDVIALPKNVLNGNVLNSMQNGFKFSTIGGKLISGREAVNLNEIVISKSLNNFFGDIFGKELYISGVVNKYSKNDQIFDNYKSTKVVVVGIRDDENNFIYHDSNWPISFFRDKLGTSSFNLIPNQIVFEFDDNFDVNSLIKRMEKMFVNYDFINPSNSIAESVDETMGFANIALTVFSVLSSFISFLLLAMIVMLNIIENKSEINLFVSFGLNHKNIKKLYITETLINGIIGFALASFEMIAFDIVLSLTINNLLKSNGQILINLAPIFIVFLITMFSCYLISFVVSSVLIKRK